MENGCVPPFAEFGAAHNSLARRRRVIIVIFEIVGSPNVVNARGVKHLERAWGEPVGVSAAGGVRWTNFSLHLGLLLGIRFLPVGYRSRIFRISHFSGVLRTCHMSLAQPALVRYPVVCKPTSLSHSPRPFREHIFGLALRAVDPPRGATIDLGGTKKITWVASKAARLVQKVGKNTQFVLFVFINRSPV